MSDGRAVGEGISIQKENEGVKGRSAGGSAKKTATPAAISL
ncbi:hypothetical protein ACIXWV_23220 [Bacteroides fragilis]